MVDATLPGLCVVVMLGVFVCLTECHPLNDYILHYQPLVYDESRVVQNHDRVRRSVDRYLYVRFNAFGKDLRIKLWPSRGVFSPQHQVYIDDKGVHYPDTSFVYQGSVTGEANSRVHLAVHNGSLEGEIHTSDNTYYIEPAAKYIADPPFRSIIYPGADVNPDPYRALRGAEAGSCGADDRQVRQFMEGASRRPDRPTADRRKQAPGEEEEEAARTATPAHTTTTTTTTSSASTTTHSERSGREGGGPLPAHTSRRRRALGTQNTCPLHLRADPMLYDYFRRVKHGREVSESQAVEEILALFSSHVSAISHIYSTTLFQTYHGDLQNAGVRFVIHRTTVMKSCVQRHPAYCNNTLDISNYLELTSQENHDLFCLVFTFTYRDFLGGILGLAWVATENAANSGVCGRHVPYASGRKKSLNAGIVSLINFGRPVPSLVSQLTFAHEVGHTFGSPHDEGSEECAPFGTTRSDSEEGNFLMFPRATGGTLPHNNKFSVCSRDNITRIIQQVIDPGSERSMCFIESDQAFCGNEITEEGEECDCGFGTCATSTCCVGREENDPDSGCRLTPSSVCSPDSGPCCGENCAYRPIGTLCRPATECQEQTGCDGSSHQCPEPVPKANGTYCSDYSKVCHNGECVGSVCQIIADSGGQWRQCFLTKDTAGNDELCYVACKNPSTGECVSSANSQALREEGNAAFRTTLLQTAQAKANSDNDDLDLAISLPAASPCDNFHGYCDKHGRCEQVDSLGPFLQLTNMLFGHDTSQRIRNWIEEHWWAVLLMCVGVVALMGIFVKVCAYNTPSTNPSAHHHHRHPHHQQQQQHQQRHRGGGQSKGVAHPRSGTSRQSFDRLASPPSTAVDVEGNPRPRRYGPQQFERYGRY